MEKYWHNHGREKKTKRLKQPMKIKNENTAAEYDIPIL